MAVRLVSVVCLLGLYCLTAAAYPAQTDAGQKEVVAIDSKPASQISSGTGLAEKANAKKMGKKAVKKTVKKGGSTAEARAKDELKEPESNTTGSLNKQNETKPEEWISKQTEKEETQLVTKPVLEIAGNLTTEKPDETSTDSFETGQTNATFERTEEPKATTSTPEALQKEVGEQTKASVSDKSSVKSAIAMVSGVVNDTIVTNEKKQKSTEGALMEAYIKWSDELGTAEKKQETKAKSSKKLIKAAAGPTNKARDRERLRLVWLLVFPFTLQLL